MKNWITTLLLISFTAMNAQQITDYQYIIVPKKFNDFDENQYKLNTYLKNLLKTRDYQILDDDASTWPTEVQQNTCLAATADVKKQKSFLKNKVEIVFTSCTQKEIVSFEGISSIKEFDKGYQDAMKTAVKSIVKRNANSNHNFAQQANIPAEITTTEKVVEAVKETKPAKSSGSNKFSNGEISLTKSDLTDGSFMLINEKSAQIYAQFFPSSKSGIYKVKFFNTEENKETIGYFDGSTIEIEQTSTDNKPIVTQFKQVQ